MNLFARRSGFSIAANGAFFFGSQRLRILQIELELLFDLKISGRPSIPDKKVGTASEFSPPPTYNVDNRVIFSLFVGKNAIFSNIDWGGWGIRDLARVPTSFGRDCSFNSCMNKQSL